MTFCVKMFWFLSCWSISFLLGYKNFVLYPRGLESCRCDLILQQLHWLKTNYFVAASNFLWSYMPYRNFYFLFWFGIGWEWSWGTQLVIRLWVPWRGAIRDDPSLGTEARMQICTAIPIERRKRELHPIVCCWQVLDAGGQLRCSPRVGESGLNQGDVIQLRSVGWPEHLWAEWSPLGRREKAQENGESLQVGDDPNDRNCSSLKRFQIFW